MNNLKCISKRLKLINNLVFNKTIGLNNNFYLKIFHKCHLFKNKWII